MAIGHVQVTTCTAPSKRQEQVRWRKKSNWPLAHIPQELCERRALTPFENALRDLSGLGFAPRVAGKDARAMSPDRDCMCFVRDKETEEGRSTWTSAQYSLVQ